MSQKIQLKLTKQLDKYVEYLAGKSSGRAKFRCDLGQKLHSVTKDWLSFSPFLHAASLCDSDNFILMLAPQGHMVVAGSNQGYILSSSVHKKREYVVPEKAMRCGFIGQP